MSLISWGIPSGLFASSLVLSKSLSRRLSLSLRSAGRAEADGFSPYPCCQQQALGRSFAVADAVALREEENNKAKRVDGFRLAGASVLLLRRRHLDGLDHPREEEEEDDEGRKRNGEDGKEIKTRQKQEILPIRPSVRPEQTNERRIYKPCAHGY